MSKKSNTFLAFLTGAATGAILGLLYEGEKNVSDAKVKAERLLDDVNGLIDKIKSGEESQL